ncbi:MAG: L-lactate dehydrogenase [Meiothermus sp.]|nr:L-lactate dehydrogenase [Meiothermus sp.]
MSKVGVVGSGLVGSTAAHTLALRGTCEEIVLLDSDLDKAQAQASDVAAAATLHRGMRVYSGGFERLAGADVVVLSAGLRQRGGLSRSELFVSNAQIFQEVIPQIVAAAPDAVILVATQPVDPLTELATRLVGEHRAAKVLGVGTVMETMQLRAAVAAHLGVSTEHVHGYVVGEEGDSALVVWSNLNVAGLPITKFAAQRGKSWTYHDQSQITDRTQRSNRRVVEGKGAVAYSVGVAIARVVEAVVRDAQVVLTVSARDPEQGLSYSMPRLVGRGGVIATVDPHLSEEEAFRLDILLNSLRNTFEKI